MVNLRAILRGLVLLAGASAFSSISWGQGFEVSGFGGAMTMDGGVGTHASYGGAGAFLLGENIHIFGEFNYSQLVSSQFSQAAGNGSTITGTANVDLASFGGGVDYSFGSSTSKVRPYVTVALGVGHFYGTGSGTNGTTSTNVSVGISNSLYVGVGGGVRFYFGKHWGVKPEVRYQRYNSSNVGLLGVSTGGANAVEYNVGLFYQFGG